MAEDGICRCMLHASTHATMLRRQLTLKPKKKIKFLDRSREKCLENAEFPHIFELIGRNENLFLMFDDDQVKISAHKTEL